ncbi:DUF1636 family protein [Roseibium sp.]|uniref:DUF1636 family protein n=1 Tax=Roseibium sp. TaxID=1936156 RepID=UPI003D12058C
MTDFRLFLCNTCQPEDADAPAHSVSVTAIAAALKDAGLAERITVESVSCLGVCSRPQALAITGKESASFLFGSVKLPDDLPDIIATCRVYLEAPNGWIEDARGCGRLRLCLAGRIPAV